MKEKVTKLLQDKRVMIGLAVVAVLVIVLVVVLVVFRKPEPVVVPTEKSEVSEVSEEPVVDTHAGLEQSVLTGEWVKPELANNQIFAIMIENTYVTLPHYNISKADVVYELPVEGGITRLMALFQDYDGLDKIGNVRSARYSFLYFAKEFDAVYAHCGCNALAEDMINAGFINDLDGITGQGGNYFYRVNDEPGRDAPHNLYTSSDLLKQALVDYGYPTQMNEAVKGHFTFAEEDNNNILSSGQDVKAFNIYYANDYPHFIYNEETGLYDRFEFDDPHMDAVTNTQIAFANVILQNADISYFNDGVVNFNPVASGTGKFFTQGKMIDITWKKESDTSATKYYDTLGNEITLKPGKTFISVQNYSDVERNGYYATVEEFKNR